MATHISHSPAETQALGEKWGVEARPGLVIGLSGDLGAGKTQLVKGLALGLGITSRVTSPTFALVNVYKDGTLVLNHLDLYRLDSPELIESAGLEDYLHPEGVSVIEWAERWPAIAELSKKTATSRVLLRQVRIDTLSDQERSISYEDFGD
jgi:tRNA threonylcarbamoyladenosine biosynthesis protein TsaE